MKPTPIHKSPKPVVLYASRISEVMGKPHCVVTIPEGSAAYNMGYRYCSIDESELADYEAGGARRYTPPKQQS